MPTKQPEAVLDTQTSRREVLKKAAYAAPVILTLAAVPTFAGKGSNSKGKGKDSIAGKSPGSVAGRGPQ